MCTYIIIYRIKQEIRPEGIEEAFEIECVQRRRNPLVEKSFSMLTVSAK